MTQRITQEVHVDIKTTGANKAVDDLNSLDKVAKKTQQSLKGLTAHTIQQVQRSPFEKQVEQLQRTLRKNDLKDYLKEQKRITDTFKKQGKVSYPLSHIEQGVRLRQTKEPRKHKIKALDSQPTAVGIKSTSGTKELIRAYTPLTKTQMALEKVRISAKKASANMHSFGESLSFANKQSKAAMFNFFRTRAIIAAIASAGLIAGGFVKNWFDLASDYAEANHLFYTTLASSMRDIDKAEKSIELHAKDVFGNVLDDFINVTPEIKKASDAVEQFAADMALDPTSVKRTYANFYELAVSAGVSYDKIATLSQGMTQLTYDLASLNDLPFEDVQKKLASGLSGVTSAVRSLGPDISRTAADAWLLAHGFETTYNALTRNNKMIVVYNMLMENTVTAQGDLARSALQPANALRLLSEQSRVAARSLGTAIFPTVTQLIPVFIVLSQVIQRAAAALAGFFTKIFGGKNGWYAEELKSWNSYMEGLNKTDFGGGAAVDGLENVEDAAGGAGKKLKELRDFQLGFDELHVLPKEPDRGGGGGGGIGGGGGGIDIPIAPSYVYGKSVWEAIEKDARLTMYRIKHSIDEVFDIGTVDAFQIAIHTMYDETIKDAKRLYDATEPIRTFIDEHWNWIEFLNGVSEGYTDIINAVTDVGVAFSDLLAPFEETLTDLPVVGKWFEILFNVLDGKVGYILGLGLGFKILAGPLKLLKFLLKPVIKVFEKLKGVFKKTGPVVGILKGKLSELPKVFDKLPTSVKSAIGKIGKAIGDFFKGGKLGKLGAVGKIGLKGTPLAPLLIAVDAVPAVIEEIKGAFGDVKKAMESEDPIKAFAEVIKKRWSAGHFVSFILKALGLGDFAKEWKKSWENITNSPVLDKFTNKIKKSFEGVKDKVGDIWDRGKKKLSNTFGAIKDDGKSKFKGFSDGVSYYSHKANSNTTSETTEMRKNGNSNFTSIGSWAFNRFKYLYSKVKYYMNYARSNFATEWTKPVIKLPHFKWDVKTVAGGLLPIFKNIDWWKTGGIFNGPSTIGVGEAGPEAVVPLSSQRMKPFAKAVSANISTGNTNFDTDVMAEKISVAVYNAMIKGFPKDIKTNVYLDSTKVNDELRRNDRMRGVGTSIVV